MKRQGDPSYNYREERAKERYYEDKYSKVEEPEAIEVKPTTLFETLAEAFRPTFFLDLISNLSGDITMYFLDPTRAVLVKPTEQEEDTDYTLLLMPMMLND